jgi:undecaprenyl-diphosphatase
MKLITASIPVLLMGLFFKINDIDDLLRSIEIIGWTMIFFGIFLYFTDRLGKKEKKIWDWTYKDSIVMGVFQVLALIPGVSRSGITISGSRILGYKRYDAIRLSMLMSIPTIMASGALLIPGLIEGSYDVSFFEILVSFVLSFFAAFLALVVLLKYLYIFQFTPYIIYRIALGFLLLWFVYS